MGTQSEAKTSMGRRRALLTDRERELLSSELDEDEKKYRYQAASRIRNKIEDELTEDIEILNRHHPELLDELRDVVCPSGRRIYCPVCGEEFDTAIHGVHHLAGPTEHDMSVEEIREAIPTWWHEEQENLLTYIGVE